MNYQLGAPVPEDGTVLPVRYLPPLIMPKGVYVMLAGFNVQASGELFAPDGTVDHGPILAGPMTEVSFTQRNFWGDSTSMYDNYHRGVPVRQETDAHLRSLLPWTANTLPGLFNWQLTAGIVLHRGKQYRFVGQASNYQESWRHGRMCQDLHFALIDPNLYNLKWPAACLTPTSLVAEGLPAIALGPGS